jgi:exonuclease SbcD
MRLLHTSDWHLGKRLFKLDRAPEHERFLAWLVETLKSQEIDVLLISGDVFDTPTPPHTALEMFYNFLHRVSEETRTETLVIAGNHDSGLLLEAPAKLLSPHRVKVWGKLSPEPAHHWTRVGSIDLCAVPFFRSYELLPQGEGDAVAALARYLDREKTGPQLLMLHHLAGIFEAAGSEQVISLSGVDSIPAELLAAFDYVALGHIHKPQKIGPFAFYSGSPIPLRFSETAKKSVVVIDEAQGTLVPRTLAVPVFRDLFIVKTTEGAFREDLLALAPAAELTAQVEVQIDLSQPRPGLIDEIKELLAGKGMELLSFIPLYQTGERPERRPEKIFELGPLELFREFYAAKYPEAGEVPADLEQDFTALLEKVRHAASPA